MQPGQLFHAGIGHARVVEVNGSQIRQCGDVLHRRIGDPLVFQGQDIDGLVRLGAYVFDAVGSRQQMQQMRLAQCVDHRVIDGKATCRVHVAGLRVPPDTWQSRR